jgi:RNA polymerase sigma factor (sigma-70 family)
VNHPVLQVLALRELAELPRGERSDGELLARFVHARDEDAFAAVVRRHGPMVLAVCRRVLGNHADADDAFQAAFLVLVRKAGALGSRRPLGPWLHGVAFNTARRLQRAGRRRAAYERCVADLPDVAAEPVNLSDELLAILDEELTRLPARYRAPIVLCDIEGRTRRQAAAQLGCPEGTVAGRLARARALLAARLASRGVTPSAGVLAAVLAQRPAGAAQSERIASVVQAAAGGPVPVRVSALVERVVAAMFLQKVKSFAAAFLVLGGLLAAAGMGLQSAASADAQPPFSADDKAATPSGDKVLTVIPLRKLDAAETATVIQDTFRGKGIVVAPIPDERSLLLYADANSTREIQELLVKLGDSSGKTALHQARQDHRLPGRGTGADGNLQRPQGECDRACHDCPGAGGECDSRLRHAHGYPHAPLDGEGARRGAGPGRTEGSGTTPGAEEVRLQLP